MVKEDVDHEENANRAKQKENLRKRDVRVKESPVKEEPVKENHVVEEEQEKHNQKGGEEIVLSMMEISRQK